MKTRLEVFEFDGLSCKAKNQASIVAEESCSSRRQDQCQKQRRKQFRMPFHVDSYLVYIHTC